MKVSAIIVCLLIISAVTCNARVEKLEAAFSKRIEEVRKNPLMAHHHQEYVSRYAQARRDLQNLRNQGNHTRGETHYMSDLLSLLVDIYKLEDKVMPAHQIYKSS